MTLLSFPRRAAVRRCSALALAAVLVAGCGSDDRSSASSATTAPPTTTAPTTAPTADVDAFPVTIEHAFGSTVVPAEPQRVVVAGLNEADYLYSLGVAPVGVHEWWGGYPYATGPWADDARTAAGAEPEVLEEFDIDPEWIASLHPDLIVVVYHEVDQAMYDALSKIAPVIANPAEYEAWSTPWRAELRIIACAVGRTDRGEEVIAGVDATIARIKAEHPELADATFETGSMDDAGVLTAYSSEDVGNQLLAELGMQVPAAYDDLAEGVFVTLSTEQLETLDLLDTFIWLDAEGLSQGVAEAIPTYTATKMHTEGRSIFPSRDMVLAMSFNTPLSIPYFLDQLAPMLAAALDGDPATTATP